MRQNIQDSRAIVFVKARATCIALAAFLKKDFKGLGIDVQVLYGKENRGGEDGKILYKSSFELYSRKTSAELCQPVSKHSLIWLCTVCQLFTEGFTKLLENNVHLCQISVYIIY